MKSVVCLFLFFVGSWGMMFPYLDDEIISEAYAQATNQTKRNISPTRSRILSRTVPILNETEISALIDVAEDVCGRSEKIYPADIKESWPQAWLESRFPMTYILKLYIPDSDGLPLFPILTSFGDFNSSLVKSSNRRFAFLNERTTTFQFLNGTTVFAGTDQALFVFRRKCNTAPAELCGIDTALDGSGTYGNAEGVVGGISIFKNVLNDQGLNTADTFTSNVPSSGSGADGGVGSNYYIVNNDPDASTTTLTIYSSFDIIDPTTGNIVLYARQITTTGPQPVPGLPI